MKRYVASKRKTAKKLARKKRRKKERERKVVRGGSGERERDVQSI